jgi:hypothetical protein
MPDHPRSTSAITGLPSRPARQRPNEPGPRTRSRRRPSGSTRCVDDFDTTGNEQAERAARPPSRREAARRGAWLSGGRAADTGRPSLTC